MAEARMVKRQEEFLKTVRRGQDMMLGAIKTVAERVQPITPKHPVVHLPLADRLPKPKDMVENTYDFAEKLLANQRKFTEDVMKATAPLVPFRGNGHAAKPKTTSK